MKLIFIRHGDPDYSIDSLTERGWKEAELLSRKMQNVKMDYIYASPLGRAQDTAKVTLEKIGREAITYPWLQEFPTRIFRPDVTDGSKKVAWDWCPGDWANDRKFYDLDHWTDNERFKAAGVKEEVEYINENLDKLLEEHGYKRNGMIYDAVKANNDTLVFFCHFAVTCVMLGHLLNITPMALWHGTCAAPTSVTTVVTEERRKGIASFRMTAFGDVSHLYAYDMEPAFAARFCECFDNKDERHD